MPLYNPTTSGAVTSANITDGTIVDADISTTAAIAQSKLAVNPLTAGLGLKAESYPVNAITTNSTPSSQTIYGTAIGLTAGMVISNVVIPVITASAGTAPTGLYVALYDSTYQRVAVSANLTTTTIAIGLQPFACSYTVTTTGLYYAAFVRDGSWGSTQIALGRTNTQALPGLSGSGVRPNISNFNHLTPPTDMTGGNFGGSNMWFWMGVS